MSQVKRKRYPGAHYFEETDKDIFIGRDNDVKKLYSEIVLSNTTVLHAESGVGKSSLIRAGLIPYLSIHNKQFIPVIIRFGNLKNVDKNKEDILIDILIKGIQKTCSQYLTKIPYLKPKKTNLWYIAKQIEQSGYRLLLIFDQFEEFKSYSIKQIEFFSKNLFHLFDTRIPKRIDKEIDTITSLIWKNINLTEEEIQIFNKNIEFLENALHTRAIFVIREDELGTMSLLSKRFSNVLKNEYRLLPLKKEQAYQAIKIPANLPDPDKYFLTKPFNFKDEAVEELIKRIDNKKTGYIDSFEIQIICSYIEKRRNDLKNSDVTKGDLPDIKVAIKNFYIEKWKKVGSELKLRSGKRRKLRLAFINELVRNGKRDLLHEDKIKEIEYGNDTIRILETEGLISKVRIADTTYYNLSHDRLVYGAEQDKQYINDKKNKTQKTIRNISVAALVFLLILAFRGYNKSKIGALEVSKKNDSTALADLKEDEKLKTDSINQLKTLIHVISEDIQNAEENNKLREVLDKNLSNLNTNQLIVRYYKRKADGNSVIKAFSSNNNSKYYLNLQDLKSSDGGKHKTNTLKYNAKLKEEKIDSLVQFLAENDINVVKRYLDKLNLAEENENIVELIYEENKPELESPIEDKNEAYNIRMYTYNPNIEVKDSIANYFKKNHYKLQQYSDWVRRPSYFATTPTLFYYDNTTKNKAKSITAKLNEAFNVQFTFTKGNGLGVSESEKRNTFLLHYTDVTKEDLFNINNSKYSINLQSYKLSVSERNDLYLFVRKSGYNNVASFAFDENDKPKWVENNTSEVIYFSDNLREKANELAESFIVLTGRDYNVSKGNVEEMTLEDEKFTFYIYNMKN